MGEEVLEEEEDARRGRTLFLRLIYESGALFLAFLTQRQAPGFDLRRCAALC